MLAGTALPSAAAVCQLHAELGHRAVALGADQGCAPLCLTTLSGVVFEIHPK